MLFFQPVPVQPFIHPSSFSGIYSEDDYVNDMAQRAAHDYALAHTRVHPFERQRDHYPHHHQRYPDGLHRGRFAPASLDNFCYGFGPACPRPGLFSPNRRASAVPLEELAYSVWHAGALDRRLEAIARQRELVREREAQRRRALAEAAAREQQARAAHEARQARDQEVLFALLSQLGLAIGPTQSASVAPQVNRPQPPVQFTHPATPAAPVPAPSPVAVDRKGKGKAVDVPVQAPALIFNAVSVPAKIPTLKEELQARIRSETDPEVQESLVLLYSDLFDAREPAQPVAGPSGHKHVSFQIPVSGPSSAASGSPIPVTAEQKVYTTAAPTHAAKPETDEAKTEEHDGARLHRTPALPPAVAAKLLKFYRARRARKLSLAQIKDVEDALRKLEGALEFPAHLDFIDRSPSPSPAESESDAESALAYTANNTPVHAYEHALNDLLTRLDAVESNGDLEVRGRRKEVVKEVERALDAMERRIEKSREHSRQRTRRGSVSSQVSDASVTVTPYNVHSSDNVDKVEVAVAAEETPVEVEEPKSISEVEAAPSIAENAPLQVEVSEHATIPTEDRPETSPTPPSVDNAEPESSPLAVGMPDSGADVNALSPSDQSRSIHGDPTSPVDDMENFDRAFDVFSASSDTSTSHLVPSAIEAAAVPSRDFDAEAVEQEYVGAASSDAQSAAVAADVAALVSEPRTAPEPAEDAVDASNASPSTQPAAVAPEAIARVESSATDATFVTAEIDSVPLSAAGDATFFMAGAAAPSEREPTQPTHALTRYASSASSGGEEMFLLSSTPLADEQPKQRRPSTSAGDDELEIIGKDELEAARNDSDWSDVESESDLEVQVV